MAGFRPFNFLRRTRTADASGSRVLEQLEQFRKRLIRSGIAIVVGMLVAFTFIERIVAFVLAPARADAAARQPPDLHRSRSKRSRSTSMSR